MTGTPDSPKPPALSAIAVLKDDFEARCVVQHRAGWIVEKDGRPIAELEYFLRVRPFHLFRVKGGAISLELRALLARRTDERAPAPVLVFRNRADLTLVVPCGNFIAFLSEDDLVDVLDIRSPPEPPPPPGALRAALRALVKAWDWLLAPPRFRSPPDPPPKPDLARRYAEHDAGWLVEKDGKVLAELLYLGPNFPWIDYRPKGGRMSEEARAAVWSAMQCEPDCTTIFRNRAYRDVVLRRGDLYMVSVGYDGLVTLRDSRPL